MTFSTYLKSKQTFLIIYFLFHGFALFVNIFDIEGDITARKPRTANYRDWTSAHFFTTTESLFDEKPSSQFWPIVPFHKSNIVYDNGVKTDLSRFKGIFFQYDISEFIAYSLMIFIILYFRWTSKDKGNSVSQLKSDIKTT